MNVENVVSCKLIIDRMQKNSLLPSTIEIINKLRRSVKAAHQRYEFDREQQKKSVKQDELNQQFTILNSEMKDARMLKKPSSCWKLVKI